jgi:phosphoadenosine phosphosulfate reductase
MNFEEKLAATRGLLQEIASGYGPSVLANSLGAEDMVLTDMIDKLQLPIGVFCLDTGRLHSETYEQLERLRSRYPSLSLQVYYPDGAALGAWVSQHGVNAFYQSIELRQQCCGLRKTEPLKRALTGKKAWITGMRREQSPTRSGLEAGGFDETHQLMKFNPLLEWSEAEVWQYLREHEVPYNALHDQHYPSIGCAPCTRAISLGEDLRAGRWWWENPETKECGLHVRIIKQG